MLHDILSRHNRGRHDHNQSIRPGAQSGRQPRQERGLGKASFRNASAPYSDRNASIAATALVHGITVVTRNLADFRPMGVPLLNSWNIAPMTDRCGTSFICVNLSLIQHPDRSIFW
jgi:hypothetical protein